MMLKSEKNPSSRPVEAPRKSNLRGRPAVHSREDVGNKNGARRDSAVADGRTDERIGNAHRDRSANEYVAESAFRYLASLTPSGFLKQDPRTGHYDLGPAAFEPSIAAVARIDPIRMASELMTELTDAVGLVSVLCVWGSNGPTVIKGESGHLETAIRMREGSNISTLITAAGRIFLAYMPPEQIAAVVSSHKKEWNAVAPKENRMTTSSIEKLRREVLANGISCASGLRNPSIAALAAPVFGPNGRLSMCLALVGIVGSFDAGFEAAPAHALKATAQRLTHMLGGRASRSTD